MKRKLLICSSLITLLLACFSFPIYADEDPTDPPSSVPIPNSIRLDQYFYDNYDLLPYIESSGEQIIDTGIKVNSELKYDFVFSDFKNISTYNYIVGNSNLPRLSFFIYNEGLNVSFFFENGGHYVSNPLLDFNLYHIVFDRNLCYINDQLVHSFDYSEFTSNENVSVFAVNDITNSSVKLYYLRIYDNSSHSFVRYYYPARSKAGGVIGLYDAVSDTFVTTSGAVPFASPIPDQVLNLQVGTFLTSSIGWITDILEFALETPIIIIFMAIAFAGVMFRWGRRIVHF